jgi:hypothetical protein
MLLLSSSGVASAKAILPAASYNSVQINVKTTNSLNATYIATAYNSSGYMIATSQSRYPTFTFMLPSSTYLFAVTALQEGVSRCYPYEGYAKAGSSQAGRAMILPPCFWNNPVVEYGYALQTVTKSTNLDIMTQPIDKMPTTNITLQVNYLNGTGAQGVSVSAYMVGEWYWWGNGNHLVLWGQTDKAGQATLVVPSVPVQVSAWVWLPVNIPKHETTVQTTVGGEKVNVTVYWQPTYAGLAGSALIIPPTNSATITLHAQKPNYWVMPYGVQSMGATSGAPTTGAPTAMGTIASGQGGVPADQYSQYQYGAGYPNGVPQQTSPPLQIAPFFATNTPDTTQSTSIVLISGATAASVAIASIGLVVAVGGRKSTGG